MPRCELLPLPDYQVAFLADGVERLRWHHGPHYPRPFFYPFLGPSGRSLTRMGHPGAPNHDHHRSIWFGHASAQGVDFWSDTPKTPSRIRQKEWLAMVDGEEEAILAVRLAWTDGHDPRSLLEQDVFAAFRPGQEGEIFLELQTVFRPIAQQLEFGKTNFGFLAVRMAKALSGAFGGGTLTNSEGQVGERAIFGQTARWMDYSGQQPAGAGEGITYFDHPSNPDHPTRWHVREDGWMGASCCFSGPRLTTQAQPLTLRYLLHGHKGPLDQKRAEGIFEEFAARPGLELVKSPARHVAYGVRRSR